MFMDWGKYLQKMKGRGETCPLRANHFYIFWSWTGSFIGIFAVAAITLRAEVPMMIGSFGASAVLIYAAIESPLAQPRNLIGGHLVSALVAVTIYQLMGRTDLSLALAVSLAIVSMQLTKSLHPPGGATALIAVDTGQDYTFVLYPVICGALIMLAVAMLVNNLSSERHYPNHW
jgi:CBS-domain-containing membrane protein